MISRHPEKNGVLGDLGVLKWLKPSNSGAFDEWNTKIKNLHTKPFEHQTCSVNQPNIGTPPPLPPAGLSHSGAVLAAPYRGEGGGLPE